MDIYADYTEFNFTNFNETYLDEDVYSELDFNSDPLIRIIASILLFILVLFGFFGNLALIHIIANKWRIQTSFNLFIANIAIADIFLTIGMTVFLFSHMLFSQFIFGEIVCKMCIFTNYFAPILSTLTIIMSLIVLQFEVIGYKYSSIAIGLTYIISLPIGIIYASFTDILKIDKVSESFTHCIEIFPGEKMQAMMKMLEKFFTVNLPFICLIVYFLLRILSKNTENRILHGFKYEKIIISIAILHVTVWSILINIEKFLHFISNKEIYVVFFVAHSLVGFSIVLKPILYAWLHEGLRKELKKIVGFKSNTVDGTQLF